MTQDELDLLHRHLHGTINEREFGALQNLLRANGEARKALRALSTVDAKLAEWAAAAPATLELLGAPSNVIQHPAGGVKWAGWNPFLTAAAGLIFGLLSGSVVWGYVDGHTGRSITLLEEGFESGPAPKVAGMPIQAGSWSGDYSEVVVEYQGVKPAGGQKMLRFLRADYEGKPVRDGYVADLFRIIDLQSPEFALAQGNACVSVEARFRSLPQVEPTKVRCGITLYALDALPSPGDRHDLFLKVAPGGPQNSGTSILATASRHEVFPPGGGAWQTARNELRLPPGARFLLVHLHESLADLWQQKEAQPIEFAGLFMDDIRATLIQRAPLR